MFINLRSHSHYSLLRALPQLDSLVKKAKSLDMPALAITDYNNMYGAIEFYKACKKKEIKPIIGVEFEMHLNGMYYHVPVYAKDFEGYQSLMRLVTEVQLHSPHRPNLTYDIIKTYGKNLIILSGGPWGEISQYILSGDDDKALEIFNWYENTLGPNSFYIEITPHTHMDRGEEIRIKTIEFARKHNKQLIATLNTHYLEESDKPAHKILCLISSEGDSEAYYKEFFSKADFAFKNTLQLEKLFSDCPEAIENTNIIADQCNVEIPLGKWYFPNIEMEVDYDSDLRKLAYEGLTVRQMQINDEVTKRLDYELEVIKNKGYSPYFLVVYDLLRYARENGILTNIRGSVAGSLVTYLLRITKCDPFIYKLPFERFLNPERPSAPDIDMDYADDRRDEIIDYARSKYGADHVAQIGTFGTMAARGAVRDVARAMKFPYVVGDKISKLIPPPRQGFPISIQMAIDEVEQLKELYDTDREVSMILDMAKNIEGNARHIGVHAAGVVIAPTPIYKFTPLQLDSKGEGKIITQYDMNSVNEDNAGLLKFDFLGIRNLTILKTAITNVKRRYNIDIDIELIPIDDKKTFEMLSRGETMGLFQLNGSGMTRFLKELKPSTIFDINAMVALYRPGPLEMIPEYIKRKHNPELVEYLDKRLEPILDQSFGVIVYQDDVMLISIHLAGYSWLEADKLRKAMGKKIPEEMAAQKEKLFKGFKAGGLSDTKIQTLWERIEPFAAYGFNKAHAASYGRVAYQTAYMKANYPVCYMTAILTEESGDIDKISEIVSECKRMGITVLPPDVNESYGGFEIVDGSDGKEEIRFGLYTIKNLGVDISDAIIAERNSGGKFTSFENFLTRVTHKNLTKKSLEALTMCGAMDSLGKRSVILANMDAILDYHKKVIKDNSNQDSLFGSEVSDVPLKLIEVPDVSNSIKLKWEKELLGLYVSGFPLDPWKDKILSRNVDIKRIIEEMVDGKTVTFAALIENIKVTKTKKGDYMALVKLRDYTAMFEVAVFPESYKKLKTILTVDQTVIVTGKIATRNDEKTLVVDDIKKLEMINS